MKSGLGSRVKAMKRPGSLAESGFYPDVRWRFRCGPVVILSDIVGVLNFAAEAVQSLMKFFLIMGSLLLSLTVGVAGSVVGALLLWLVWEAFNLCTVFGGPMEGSCGYAYTFFLLPITALICLVAVTIFSFRKVYPWLVRRRATPR